MSSVIVSMGRTLGSVIVYGKVYHVAECGASVICEVFNGVARLGSSEFGA